MKRILVVSDEQRARDAVSNILAAKKENSVIAASYGKVNEVMDNEKSLDIVVFDFHGVKFEDGNSRYLMIAGVLYLFKYKFSHALTVALVEDDNQENVAFTARFQKIIFKNRLNELNQI